MELLKIIIAVLIVGLIARYITYILSFLSVIPVSLMGLLMFGIALDIVLFVIHRRE